MEENKRGSLTIGVLLVLVGAWFLAIQFVPDLESWVATYAEWPWWVIGVGVVFLIAAVVGGVPGLAIPAAIIGGIGVLLYFQDANNDYASWAYAWTLIPGFVGIGIFLSRILEGKFRKGFREGLELMFISLILFAIFASFLGGPSIFGVYWPVLLIVWGVWIFLKPALRSRRSAE